MVITTPSTAATMPRPGSESATVLNADTGCIAWWWWTSISNSII